MTTENTPEASYGRIVAVHAVAETSEVGAFSVHCTAALTDGSEIDLDYMSRPDAREGWNPAIRDWLTSNPDFPISPYVPPVPPTVEELRAQMPALTSRQFWLAALEIDVTKATVETAIKGLSLTAKDEARMLTELLEATTFERLNPFLNDLTDLMQLPQEQLDSLWTWAAEL